MMGVRQWEVRHDNYVNELVCDHPFYYLYIIRYNRGGLEGPG